MRRFHIRVDSVLAAVMVLLGLWSLYAQVCVLARASFTTLRAFAFLPLLATSVVLWRTSRVVRPVDANATARPRAPGWPPRWRWMRIVGPFAISGIYAVTGWDLLFWLLAVIYLSAEIRLGQRNEAVPEVSECTDSRFEVGALLMLCALAALLTSGARRPDADDAYFLSVATSAVNFPDNAPQSFDALHRSGLPPVEQVLHLPQVYEILIGLLSSISGVSVQVLYYIVLPPLWAMIGVLANWLVLRHFLRPRDAIWGTAIFVLSLVFWGDGHATFGNFSYVRLFQGKAVYVAVALPLIVLAALRYRERPGITTWFSLALSQCAAAGLTTNGVVVAPLAAAMAIVARPSFDTRSVRTMLGGASASMPLMIVSAAMYLKMAPYLSAVKLDPMPLSYATTLGTVRAPLVLLALTLLPVLAARAGVKCADWIAGYVWIVTLVIFNPGVWILAAIMIGHVYSWRLFWAVPVPFLLSLAGGIAIGATGASRWWSKGVVAAWTVAFALVGPAAVSSNLFSLKNFGLPKVIDAPFAVAEETVSLARPDDLALLPEAVAVYATGFPHPPPLVGVRELYLNKLHGFIPDDQLASRVALFRYATRANEGISISTALKEIDAQCIATVVFPKAHRDASILISALTERGFAVHSSDGFVIAARPK